MSQIGEHYECPSTEDAKLSFIGGFDAPTHQAEPCGGVESAPLIILRGTQPFA